MKAFLDRFRGIYKPLIWLPVALAIISIIMMFSTSYDNGIVISREVIVQTVAYILGVICIVVIVNIDYTTFPNYEKWIYIGSLVLLLMVYLPFIGVERNGARSWINLGIMDFQPSEIVKITFILLFANYLVKHKRELYNFVGFGKAFLYAAPFIAIVTKEDLGSGLVFLVIWIVMVFYAGLDYKVFGKTVALVAIATPIAYKFLASHQKERIDAFLHPSNLSLAGNYQVYQSKVSIGSGGFFGKGIFRGTQTNLSYLPVSNSDFVFSSFVEEFGFIGGGAVIGIFAWFIYAILKTAKKCKDAYGTLIVVGIAGMLAFQIFENIAMTMGLMPVTGITLPFLSYGGSGIISNMIALGFVLNVAVTNKDLQF